MTRPTEKKKKETTAIIDVVIHNIYAAALEKHFLTIHSVAGLPYWFGYLCRNQTIAQTDKIALQMRNIIQVVFILGSPSLQASDLLCRIHNALADFWVLKFYQLFKLNGSFREGIVLDT